MNGWTSFLCALIVASVLRIESRVFAQYGEPRSRVSSAPPRIGTRGLAATPAPRTAQAQLPLAQALAAPVDPKVELRLRLNAELTRLTAERAQISLGGPLTLLIGGGAAMAIGFTVIVMSGMHGGDHSEERNTGLVVLIAGAATLSGGAGWLIAVKPERRRLGLRIKEVRRELELLGGVGPDRANVGMRVRF